MSSRHQFPCGQEAFTERNASFFSWVVSSFEEALYHRLCTCPLDLCWPRNVGTIDFSHNVTKCTFPKKQVVLVITFWHITVSSFYTKYPQGSHLDHHPLNSEEFRPSGLTPAANSGVYTAQLSQTESLSQKCPMFVLQNDCDSLSSSVENCCVLLS